MTHGSSDKQMQVGKSKDPAKEFLIMVRNRLQTEALRHRMWNQDSYRLSKNTENSRSFSTTSSESLRLLIRRSRVRVPAGSISFLRKVRHSSRMQLRRMWSANSIHPDRTLRRPRNDFSNEVCAHRFGFLVSTRCIINTAMTSAGQPSQGQRVSHCGSACEATRSNWTCASWHHE